MALITEIAVDAAKTAGHVIFKKAFQWLTSGDVVAYFRGMKLDEELLKMLEIELMSIDAFLDDAEQKQIDVQVKEWLDAVKEAALDAEDLFDEIDAQVYQCNRKAESPTFANKVMNYVDPQSPSLLDMNIKPRMEHILGRLKHLASKMNIHGLSRQPDGSGVGSQKVPLTSLLVDTVIYGRDDDKEILFNWLLPGDTENDKHHLSIISIVSMPGMGKTALAQHLYNDPRMKSDDPMVKDKFDIKAWVYVSHEFDVLRVTRAILKEITGSIDDSTEFNSLQVNLKKNLDGKRLLLVLDDIWNKNYTLWKSLLVPFNGVAQGSKIVVTTQNKDVASKIRSTHTRELIKLQEEHGWELLSKHALPDGISQFSPDFKEVGMKIVDKCNGLPLSLKAIGCVLYDVEPSASKWKQILASEVWEIPNAGEEMVPALMLSYQNLPSHLKRCFDYCSLFPKGHLFEKEELILLWMAQNFLKSPQHGKSIEEVGEEYFDDLLARSFFQLSSGDQRQFIMHDLFNSLAKHVSGDFVYRLEVEKPQSISKRTRHFSFLRSTCEPSKTFEALDNDDARKFRTFLPLGWTPNEYLWESFWMSTNLTDVLISKFKLLRALSFSGYAMVELPASVGNLTYLCYLNLSRTRIKNLPDSICLLYNLEILKLEDCQSLEELPLNFHELTNLRYLDLSGTKVRKMPMHFEKLKNLQVLSSFYVGKDAECNIQQLGDLNLHGALSIKELQNIVNPMDAKAANLKNKIHLVKLDLRWCANNADDPEKEREVLEALQPSEHLKTLSMWNYNGRQFPNWFGDCSLSNVVFLKLGGCKNCLFLPPLGLLPSLKQLSMIGFHNVVVIGHGFYGNAAGIVPFASLETLVFEDMNEWEEWEDSISEGDVFPRLQELCLRRCPKLKNNLPKHLPHLKKLNISYCEELVASVPQAPAIQELALCDCGNLKFGDHPSTLQRLWIGGHNMGKSLLKKIGHTISGNSLVELTIYDCPNMHLPLRRCYNSLMSLYIRSSCESLKFFPLALFPNLCSLRLEKCPHLKMIKQEGDSHSHYLTHLDISWCPKFDSFLGGRLSAPKLESFCISGLEELRSLPENMRQRLPSLVDIGLLYCPNLESLPDGGLPPNLEYLSLGGSCKRFMESLKQTLATNTSLLQLSIDKMGDVESFPDEGLLPHSLTSMVISNFPELTKLDYRGLCHLASLTQLRISICPKLQRLPEEGLPKSISKLHITRMCPLLIQRCQKPNGEDWGKISHIKKIKIDNDFIS